MEDVLVKVSTLNDFYSTNILAAYKVAKHILSLDIDERLNKGDMTLVDDISKIEMGESLILSWLKHIKNCQLIQLNWTVSPEWSFQNKDIIAELMNKANDLFSSKYGYDIFKNNSLEQLISQSEADAVGISFDENGAHIYAADIAFHEGGLNYGSREEQFHEL